MFFQQSPSNRACKATVTPAAPWQRPWPLSTRVSRLHHTCWARTLRRPPTAATRRPPTSRSSRTPRRRTTASPHNERPASPGTLLFICLFSGRLFLACSQSVVLLFDRRAEGQRREQTSWRDAEFQTDLSSWQSFEEAVGTWSTEDTESFPFLWKVAGQAEVDLHKVEATRWPSGGQDEMRWKTHDIHPSPVHQNPNSRELCTVDSASDLRSCDTDDGSQYSCYLSLPNATQSKLKR